LACRCRHSAVAPRRTLDARRRIPSTHWMRHPSCPAHGARHRRCVAVLPYRTRRARPRTRARQCLRHRPSIAHQAAAATARTLVLPSSAQCARYSRRTAVLTHITRRARCRPRPVQHVRHRPRPTHRARHRRRRTVLSRGTSCTIYSTCVVYCIGSPTGSIAHFTLCLPWIRLHLTHWALCTCSHGATDTINLSKQYIIIV
jgi:hypothetical protein